MTPFVSSEKMSKKARRELDSRKRAAWRISPVTRRAESKKAYSRKRKPRIRWDEQLPFLCLYSRNCAGQFNHKFNAWP